MSQKEVNHLLSLPDALFVSIFDFLNDKDLLRIELVCKQLRTLFVSGLLQELWKSRCERRWQSLPRYRLTESRERWLDEHLKTTCWKARYLWIENDLSRTEITKEEVETLHWYFNFTRQAGGKGKQTLRRCIFRHGLLFLSGFPPLPYHLRIVPSPNPNRVGMNDVVMFINDFPPHYIERLPSCGEWLITNHNVTLVSCDEAWTLTYTDRGFQ